MTGAAAVGAALLTVLVGTLILADVSGPRAAAPPRATLTAHIVFALAGLVLVGVGAATATTLIAVVAAVVLASTGVVGIVALRRTLAVARTTARTRPSNGILVVHGAAAAFTIILAVVAAGR